MHVHVVRTVVLKSCVSITLVKVTTVLNQFELLYMKKCVKQLSIVHNNLQQIFVGDYCHRCETKLTGLLLTYV